MKKYRVWVTPDLSDLPRGFEIYIEANSFADASDSLVNLIEHFANPSLEYQLFDSPEGGQMLFFRTSFNVIPSVK